MKFKSPSELIGTMAERKEPKLPSQTQWLESHPHYLLAVDNVGKFFNLAEPHSFMYKTDCDTFLRGYHE